MARHPGARLSIVLISTVSLGAVLLAAAGNVAGHGTPIAGTEDIHDALVLQQMQWSWERNDEDLRIVDLTSVAANPLSRLPVTAFRYHGDIGWVEGSMMETGEQEDVPIFNTGVRPLNLRVEPPLRYEGYEIARIDLPVLLYDNNTIEVTPDSRIDSYDRIVVHGNATVPMPDKDGITPPVVNVSARDNASGTPQASWRASGLRVTTEFTLSEIGESHPEFGDIGSATGRLRITLLDDAGIWQVAQGTHVVFHADLDLGGSAFTQRLVPNVISDADGLLFARNDDYAWLKVAPYVYPPAHSAQDSWGLRNRTDRPQAADVNVYVTNTQSLALSTESRPAVGPFRATLNVTYPAGLAYADGLAFEFHLGYAVDNATDVPDDAGAEEQPSPNDTPGVGLGLVLVSIAGMVSLAPRRRRP